MLRRLSRGIRNNILVGLALVTPLGITILIANWLFVFVTNVFLTAQLETSGKQLLYRTASLLIVLALCLAIGFFARSFLGRRLYRIGDYLLARMPVINRIYVQVRHMSEVLISQRETLFQEVVLVEYPRRGLYSIGFVTAPVPGSLAAHMDGDAAPGAFISLFIPTTPNPTSGLMIMAPREEVKPLAIEVPDAMKFVVSAGAVHPGDNPSGVRSDLLDKLEAWANRQGRADDQAQKDRDHG
jgi:uncharacterized membrane protein